MRWDIFHPHKKTSDMTCMSSYVMSYKITISTNMRELNTTKGMSQSKNILEYNK